MSRSVGLDGRMTGTMIPEERTGRDIGSAKITLASAMSLA
jgi:hypothetical protein